MRPRSLFKYRGHVIKVFVPTPELVTWPYEWRALRPDEYCRDRTCETSYRTHEHAVQSAKASIDVHLEHEKQKREARDPNRWWLTRA